MSAIAYDRMTFEAKTKTEAPAHPPIKINKKYNREEEFNSALALYLAEYRRNRSLVADKAARQVREAQMPLGRRTAEVLMYLPWF